MTDKKVLTEGVESWDTRTEDEDDKEHLMEVLTRAQQALGAFWRLAEPLLVRGATRNMMGSISWSYYQVSDALSHSVEWLRRMPQRADDGTRVWEESPMAAVTNELEVRSDQVARRATNTDGVSGSREERDSVPDGAATRERKLEREVRIERWKASQAQRKAAMAKAGSRARWYGRKRRGKT